MVECCFKRPSCLAIEHIADAKLNLIHDVLTNPRVCSPHPWPNITDLAPMRPSPNFMLAKWYQSVGQTICRTAFVRNKHTILGRCDDFQGDPACDMVGRPQVLADENLGFGVAPPAASGRSDVCLAHAGRRA